MKVTQRHNQLVVGGSVNKVRRCVGVACGATRAVGIDICEQYVVRARQRLLGVVPVAAAA